MTRSMPSISSSGNMRPASMTTMSLPCSMASMFLPISPTPPSGMTRRASLTEQRHLVGGLLLFDRLRDRRGGDEERECREVRDHRRPQRGLTQRRGGVEHREDDEAIGRLAELAVDARDRLR